MVVAIGFLKGRDKPLNTTNLDWLCYFEIGLRILNDNGNWEIYCKSSNYNLYIYIVKKSGYGKNIRNNNHGQ